MVVGVEKESRFYPEADWSKMPKIHRPRFAPPDVSGVDASLLAIGVGTTRLIILSHLMLEVEIYIPVEKPLKANVVLAIK